MNNPCIDSGNYQGELLAENICFETGSGSICLNETTTRLDKGEDLGVVDMGFHHIVPLNKAFVRVPEDHPTIQAGIDAVINGGTVLVANGIYTGEGNRDLEFHDKSIIVTSAGGPDQCIIELEGNPSNPHRAFSLWDSG